MAEWITISACLLAAVLSRQAAGQARQANEASERAFWNASGVLLILFGINELLDVQTLLTFAARAHARANDWYEHRRAAQYAFVLALAAIMAAVGIVVLWLTRRMHPAILLAQAGLGFILAFVFLRAASFHHVEEVLGRAMPGFRVGWLQETGGMVIVAAAALLYVRRRPGAS